MILFEYQLIRSKLTSESNYNSRLDDGNDIL